MFNVLAWDVAKDSDLPDCPYCKAGVGGMWIGEVVIESGSPAMPEGGTRFIPIMAVSKFTWEQATDAFLDFLDRLRTGRLPRGLTEPRELMEMCVQSTRRQR